ncbi:glycosyltransferase family 2 protein [Oceanobacillus halotolerans]|uniref:glycosyltransferase family 2 protein n=1 Tax=Oceanobacillus halotolerans TaxID=2663380 RepID=UPI001CF7CE45|nr:glycosyltransferase family 2 protein [Oceanobacillus halotolerans]
MLKKILIGPIDWLLYSVLRENHRQALANMFSAEQKEKLKSIINGKQQIQRKKLKQIKYHLYNLGFVERGLQELEAFHNTAKNAPIKRLAAWELVQWHANKYTEEGAKLALTYIPAVHDGETDQDQLRRIAIIHAECLDLVGDPEQAKSIIHKRLVEQEHADLYLARANLVETLDQRLNWINKAMGFYQLQPISFSSRENQTYDDLQTDPMDRAITDGPKVSVILPAYNAEDGIGTAIESILSQTWRNIELLIVDDHSPDNTVAVVKDYMQQDSRIKLLQTPVNSGPYVARNIALNEATGDFVTINDADDWSHREKIEKQATHLVENSEVIANTSEHARLTEEDLKLYRRGTPGKYIFPNMSSIMFRRKPVLERIGYWDSVRFAADGEFKRRLLKEFGKQAYVDLSTGPLSLPRQSVSSLTGSSAFGYNGFFMGVRKEYVESLESYHQQAESLYYPYPMEKRPFPVPEPMWPKREEKQDGRRFFDVVIATDFRIVGSDSFVLKEINRHLAHDTKRIGLVQMNQFDLTLTSAITTDVRNVLDGDRVQMVVYGEKINTDQLIVIHSAVLEDKQKYVADIQAETIQVVVTEEPNQNGQADNIEHCLEQLETYFGSAGKWYPLNHRIRESFSNHVVEKRNHVDLANEDWETLIGHD